MKNLTIEQLAEKLNGKLWVKGDLKRIYLDRGYNTKKISTKTYVYDRGDGSFAVSCTIECPSQPWAWISSQKDEVIESVEAEIEDAMADTVYLIVNQNGEVVNSSTEVSSLYWLYSSDYSITEGGAKAILKDMPEGYSIKAMDRNEFDAEVERLGEIERANRPEPVIVTPLVAAPAPAKKEIKNTDTPTYGVGATVNHGRFGNGIVKAESTDKIEVEFSEVGVKALLKKFAPLTLVNNG